MPTLLLPILPTQVKINYREPLTTAPLNQKLAGVLPSGVYRGFKLGLPLAAEVITVIADVEVGDQLAVIETITGFSLTVKLVGNFTISLTPFIGSTVIIALFGSYVVGPPTTVELRAYDLLTEYNLLTAAQQGELVVLGTVVVTAGIIPIAQITSDHRDGSWQRTPAESIAWAPVLRNPSFEWGRHLDTSPRAAFFWETTVSGVGTWQLQSGFFSSFSGNNAMALITSAPGLTSATLKQFIFVPVVDGQRLRMRLYFELRNPLLVDGTRNVELVFLNNTGAALPAVTVLLPFVPFVAGYQKLEQWITPPVGAVYLAFINVRIGAINFNTFSDALWIDDVQIWVETLSALAPYAQDQRQLAAGVFGDVIIGDSTLPAGHATTALELRFDSTSPAGEGKLIADRRDQLPGGVAIGPALQWLGRFFLGEHLVDTAAKAALPRVTAPYAQIGAIDYTLMWASPPSAGGAFPTARVYVSSVASASPGALVLVINAPWDNTTHLWTKDDVTTFAAKLDIGRGNFNVFLRDSIAGTWTDALTPPPSIVGWTSGSLQMNLLTLFTTIAGRLNIGGEAIATAANILLARLQAPVPSSTIGPRTLLFETTFPGVVLGQGTFRVYSLNNIDNFPQGIEITRNARWTVGNTWVPDRIIQDAYCLRLDANTSAKLRLLIQGAITPASWIDGVGVGAWGTEPFVFDNGLNTLSLNDMHINFLNNTLTNVSAANQLIAKLIPKAIGLLTPGAGAPVFIAGGTVGLNAPLVAGLAITFTFGFGNGSGNYVVVTEFMRTTAAGANVTLVRASIAGNVITLAGFSSTDVQLDLNIAANNFPISILVFGAE